MGRLKLTGKQIRMLGFPEGAVIRDAMQAAAKLFRHTQEEEGLQQLQQVLNCPTAYLQDKNFGKIAARLIPPPPDPNAFSLSEQAVLFRIFGETGIEPAAIEQMQNAARLPITVAGALMPDAHHGYGLPIGGVLATDNAIIPYAVGVDIGCRMSLSIFDLPPADLESRHSFFQRELVTNTLFGAGKEFDRNSAAPSHEVLDSPLFHEISFLKGLKDKAAKQLGSSGSGNHFVEFGVVTVTDTRNSFGVVPGNYIGLLSHSGSRGLGANIAAHFTGLAKDKTRLPPAAKELAWLGMDTEAGLEYWHSMNLAGDYASACHDVIHKKIFRALGAEPIARIENHHNFAWKEKVNGKELIVHRKGATPAGENVLGIIPGSMTEPGFIVRGRGNPVSLNSASHGAGRKMSRSKALANISREELNAELKKKHVTLIGGGLDEAPFAYKDIHEVMNSQSELVDVLGKFYPRIVKMDDTPPRRRRGASG